MAKKPSQSSAASVDPQRHIPRELEFRCISDDAWYGVSLRIETSAEGEELEKEMYIRVMYTWFSEFFDERYAVGRFRDVEELETFGKRFRLSSVQLQDFECWKVEKGLVICSSCIGRGGGGGELKFFDAVVRSTHRFDHKFPNMEEEEEDQVCTCVFDLLWQHGPHRGNITSNGIENICLIQEDTQNLDPSLTIFLDLTRKKIHSTRLSLSGRISDKLMEDILDEDSDLGSVHLSSSTTDSTEAFYSVWMENLEMDIAPKNIVDFVFRQTFVSSQALVFPCPCSDFYQRGVVIVDARDKIIKIINFLHDPSHIIVSSRGRPWVTPEKRWQCNSDLQNLFLKNAQRHLSRPDSNLDGLTGIKVVQEGSVEFEKTKRLSDLFLEFYNHVCGLSGRLAAEERKLFIT